MIRLLWKNLEELRGHKGVPEELRGHKGVPEKWRKFDFLLPSIYLVECKIEPVNKYAIMKRKYQRNLDLSNAEKLLNRFKQ